MQVDGPEESASKHELSLGDAIRLATGVALQEEFGVQNLTVQSFDEGKRRDGQTGKKLFQWLAFTFGAEQTPMMMKSNAFFH